MFNEELNRFLCQLERLHEENKLIVDCISELAGKLERFTVILEQLLLPSQPEKIKIGHLSSIKGIKKVTIKNLNVRRLDRLEFNLDSVDVEELSGVLNIGISESFNVKSPELPSNQDSE